MPRLFITHDLNEGETIALDQDQARYLGDVMRLKAGALVHVFNGRDGEFAAQLGEVNRRGARIEIGARARAQSFPPDLTLLFSPLKRQATDWLVEKATELGAAALQPVMMRRTVAETVRLDRLTAIAREAAEQTERLDVPEVRAPLTLAKVLEEWDASRPLIYCDEQGEAKPILDALDALLPRERKEDRAQRETDGAESQRSKTSVLESVPSVSFADRSLSRGSRGSARRISLLIGPEGGFDPDERRLLRALDFVIPVSLGPRILRAETAAVAGLALLQARWGDWR